MQQASDSRLPVWLGVLLAAAAAPVVLLTRLWPGKQTADRTPDEVAGVLRAFIDGTGGVWDWDDFESTPITDPRLDALRHRAVQAGPPDTDVEALAAVLAEVEAMARNDAGSPGAG
ncbi:hypothetical protein G5B46_10550 [Caulobacter sp. 602-2]|uniref:Uncharacterized protein n=1 Tax=Caulobacter sp. 602-2 TaxID=2710887 RepID=A0A6G4QX57_9CAUL|nr:hypothetical protein [Caulobacter sp. 602-2]NGM50047.1 hypothetical protein [Caulobacter sp. 602-2]